MPMYEYTCDGCANTFALLRRMEQSDEGIVCPTCQSAQVHRQFSVFASLGKETIELTASSSDRSGGCCGGACGCSG